LLNEKISLTANEVLNNSNYSEREAPRFEEVKDFILDILKFGSVPLTEIVKKATKLGFGKKILYKAKDDLKIVTEKSITKGRGTIWMLPS
jgi:hypothetical protein